MSVRTNLSTLQSPKGPFGDRQTDVAEQGVSVPAGWWRRHLAEDDWPSRFHEDPAAANVVLTRQDVWEMAQEARTSPTGARRLLWASVAWGAGHRLRLCRRRITSVEQDRDRVGERLREAAVLARADAVAAYALMHPPRGQLVRYLGPAFGTKYLYFAGGGHADHPALILDSRVATSLVRHGWTSLDTSGGWPSATYGRYVKRMRAWSDELGGSTAVATDQIEKVLFDRGARRVASG